MSEGNVANQFSVTEGSKLSEPMLKPREDYIFVGWYTDNNTFNDKWLFTVNTVTDNVTLYALWKEGTSYSFVVYECNEEYLSDNEPYYVASSAIISIRDKSGNEVGQYTTDDYGKLTIKLEKGDYYYQVTKGNASNISKDGFLIIGIFHDQEEIDSSPQQPAQINTPWGLARPGGLKFADLNGDGTINNDDRPVEGYVPLLSSQDVYIAAADFTPYVLPEPDKRRDCDILSFSVEGVSWTINSIVGVITHLYPKGTNVSNLTPVIEISHGASISPASGVAQNFSDSRQVTYVVTAENGTTKTYIAMAEVTPEL